MNEEISGGHSYTFLSFGFILIFDKAFPAYWDHFHYNAAIQFLQLNSLIIKVHIVTTLTSWWARWALISPTLIVYSTVYSGSDQRKRKSSASSNTGNISIWWRHHGCNLPHLCSRNSCQVGGMCCFYIAALCRVFDPVKRRVERYCTLLHLNDNMTFVTECARLLDRAWY